jgi:hypothetical protein
LCPNLGCCGDGQCNETCDVCAQDCGACVCGDGKCEGETCGSCAADCGTCPSCAHSVCTVGVALDQATCPDSCVSAVCAQKPGCCAPNNNSPAWSVECSALAGMLPACKADTCVAKVCAQTPSCCALNGAFSQACVDAAKALCATPCNCAHGVCTAAEKLDAACDPCATAVCATDPYCCDTAWDGICVGEAGSICKLLCQ